MALSGSFNTTAYSGRYLTFSWTATQNVTANTSTISWTLKGAGTGTGYYMAGNFKVVINGETVYSSADRIQLRVGTLVASGTKTITHNGDGTKSFSASAEAGIYAVAVNCRGSANFTLNTIPRASTMTCGPGVINGWHTININRASSAFTHTVTYKFGSLTGSVYTKTNQTSLTWIIPDDFYTQIPNNKSGTCTLTCETYNGASKIGTSTATFTVSVNENECAPTLSPFVWDTNPDTMDLTGSDTVLVRYHSIAHAENNGAARKSATVRSVSIKNGSQEVETNTYDFNSPESADFIFGVIDSRGIERSETVTTQMIPYIHLTCVMGNNRPNAAGELNLEVTGSCFNGNFGAANNELSVQYRYKKGSGTYTPWQAMSLTRSGNTYKATASIRGLDYRESYTFQAMASDRLEEVTTDSKPVKSLPVFDWSGEDFNFNVPVHFSAGFDGGGSGGESLPITGGTLTGDLRLKDDRNYGLRILFGDGEYVYLGELADDVLTIKAKDIKLETTRDLYLNGETVEYGTWNPSVTGVSTWGTRKGWYKKVGNVVTVGWHLNGTFSSSTTTSTDFKISGLPFTNGSTLAAGGGVAFNLYVSANNFIAGYVISPGLKVIETRCTSVRTSAGGVVLGAGAKNYPRQNFVSSGTITYTTA